MVGHNVHELARIRKKTGLFSDSVSENGPAPDVLSARTGPPPDSPTTAPFLHTVRNCPSGRFWVRFDPSLQRCGTDRGQSLASPFSWRMDVCNRCA